MDANLTSSSLVTILRDIVSLSPSRNARVLCQNIGLREKYPPIYPR
jgi:hypothetical protein